MKTNLLEKRHDSHVTSLTESVSQKQNKSKLTGNCWVFKSPRRSVDENNRCVFRVKPPFSNSFVVV